MLKWVEQLCKVSWASLGSCKACALPCCWQLQVTKSIPNFYILLFNKHVFSDSTSIYLVFIPQFNPLSHLSPLSLHPSLPSLSFSPSLQCWMSAILPPVLLFSDEANGGPSIKGHQATQLLAVHQSLYSDWLAGRGLIAFAVFSDLPYWPRGPDQPNHTHIHSRELCLCKIMHIDYKRKTWYKHHISLNWFECHNPINFTAEQKCIFYPTTKV